MDTVGVSGYVLPEYQEYEAPVFHGTRYLSEATGSGFFIRKAERTLPHGLILLSAAGKIIFQRIISWRLFMMRKASLI